MTLDKVKYEVKKKSKFGLCLRKEMLKSTKLIGMLVLLIWFRQENKKGKIGMVTLRGVWLTTEIMTRMFPTFGTTMFFDLSVGVLTFWLESFLPLEQQYYDWMRQWGLLNNENQWKAMTRVFLAVQDSSIGDLVTHSVSQWVSQVTFDFCDNEKTFERLWEQSRAEQSRAEHYNSTTIALQ